MSQKATEPKKKVGEGAGRPASAIHEEAAREKVCSISDRWVSDLPGVFFLPPHSRIRRVGKISSLVERQARRQRISRMCNSALAYSNRCVARTADDTRISASVALSHKVAAPKSQTGMIFCFKRMKKNHLFKRLVAIVVFVLRVTFHGRFSFCQSYIYVLAKLLFFLRVIIQ